MQTRGARNRTHFWIIVLSRINLLTRIFACFSKSSYIYTVNRSDQPRSPAALEQKKAYLAFLGREFQRHQLYRFRRKREKRFALEFRIFCPA